jgi:arylsulfatase A-like enzyme
MKRKAAKQCLNRRRFLVTAGSTIGGICFGRSACSESEHSDGSGDKPNIIVILSDDQGYADVSCYDHAQEVNTPNIDILARDGVRLTDGYASCPVCAPTRAGLLTGRYQQRFGIYYNSDVPNSAFGDEITVAQVLKKYGYATGIVGKWHLGSTPEKHPNSKGFDEFYGFLGGGHKYFDLDQEGNPLYRNNEIVRGEKGYLTDVFTREAVSFIDRHGKTGKSFFLYLPYNAPHKPEEAREKYLKKFNTGDPTRDNYLARLASLDEGIGKVLNALMRNGIYDDTLVFFLSDNGGTSAGADNGILRGGKCTFYEGGIRVPFIVSWPKRLPAARVCSVPIISLDVFPTAVAAAGGKMPGGRTYDGKNMMPALAGKTSEALHDSLFWDTGRGAWAVRHGKWKLVCSDGAKYELFDLDVDLDETKDLADKKPELVERLKKLHDEWKKEMGSRQEGTLK